jgi:ribosomal protein S16
MLTIKLAKIGKKNKKLFRVIICEKTQDPYGKALEILGSYNPYNKELVIKADRVKYWISKGSSMTPSVNNLLIEKKIIEGKKAVNSKPGTPNKRKTEKIEKAKQKEVEKEEKEKVEAPVETPAEVQTETTENTEKTE